ncbi:MAG: glycoside hydrolase family 127 protein [Abditibacteriota bacterium]|nr:glycoside hydrolase family 127 protein [Abditibacteriota bacterium]
MMKTILILAAVLFAAAAMAAGASDTRSLSKKMKVPKYSVWNEADITSIRPAGRFAAFLETQIKGLTGHPEAHGIPFNTPGWMADHINPAIPPEGRWVLYEHMGYYSDGAIRCAYLTDNKELAEKAEAPYRHFFEREGALGPEAIRDPSISWNRWPYATFLRGAIPYLTKNPGEANVRKLADFFLTDTADYSEYRAICCLEIMLWLYEKTGDRRLLNKAEKAYDMFQTRGYDSSIAKMQSDIPSHEHGVSHNEMCKMAAVMYEYTGERAYLDAVENEFRKLAKYSIMVNGVISSSEGIKGKDSLASNETCNVTDQMWALSKLLRASGRPLYADMIERICFNALPGCVLNDFGGLQYFSCPNQILADAHSNHNEMFKSHTWMSYRPKPGTECCSGNVHRAMPCYISEMWAENAEGGVFAALYGASEYTARNGAVITEDTDYPFDETVSFSVKAPAEFDLYLRIPGWCSAPELTVNGQAANTEKGRYFPVRVKDGDRLELRLPMEISLSRWPENGIALERGPLVYSLAIDTEWSDDPSDDRFTPDFPAQKAYPKSPWNYALALDEPDFINRIKVVKKETKGMPWSPETCPVELYAPAKRVPGWKAIKAREAIGYFPVEGKEGLHPVKKTGDFTFTPPLPSLAVRAACRKQETETVKLIPYGAAKLRITIFPDYRFDSFLTDEQAVAQEPDTHLDYELFGN